MIKVTCDAHGWMHGWWVATDTPYFAVTDDKGNYTIKDVPPGDYTVEVWQEKLGTDDAEGQREGRRDRDDQFLDEAQGLVARYEQMNHGAGAIRLRFSLVLCAQRDRISSDDQTPRYA